MDPSAHDPAGNLDSATLFSRHARFVASFLYRQGARSPDLEDLVQEVFLAAHRKGGYRLGAASPTTFLAQLALQANLKRRRQAGRTPPGHEQLAGTFSEPPPDPGQALDAARGLQRALDAMAPEQRAVFVLFELEGERCEAIAAGLGIALGTVHSRLHAARQLFQDSVASEARQERVLACAGGRR